MVLDVGEDLHGTDRGGFGGVGSNALGLRNGNGLFQGTEFVQTSELSAACLPGVAIACDCCWTIACSAQSVERALGVRRAAVSLAREQTQQVGSAGVCVSVWV